MTRPALPEPPAAQAAHPAAGLDASGRKLAFLATGLLAAAAAAIFGPIL
jgi:hypothetical protein